MNGNLKKKTKKKKKEGRKTEKKGRVKVGPDRWKEKSAIVKERHELTAFSFRLGLFG